MCLPPIENFKVLGNASLAGAYLGLVDPSALAKMTKIASGPEIIEPNKFPVLKWHLPIHFFCQT